MAKVKISAKTIHVKRQGLRNRVVKMKRISSIRKGIWRRSGKSQHDKVQLEESAQEDVEEEPEEEEDVSDLPLDKSDFCAFFRQIAAKMHINLRCADDEIKTLEGKEEPEITMILTMANRTASHVNRVTVTEDLQLVSRLRLMMTGKN
ncbi:hypothetical protein GLAREA_09894 [Glarea lozoyensis ATCC 20868]|uniref:Uncharacterized protein n=1 Tax=Glarea lozoyensis (strain ATCC 20868 / MF5171) TaxID=1116229 RepID=S3DQN7_GLAL2|nr:uncharacterized protein GLAREA_09894 [Glarea lozoyensis ATCC 20868]EPE28773.1 hypothetical protein GLAREA_09894 [Glarea lozoyensis ATCC 20868]